jgi:hypothetical protein
MSEGAVLEQQRIRTERALNLLAGGQIRFQPDRGQGWLALDAEGEAHHLGPDACDCEDFLRRCAPLRIRCKHLEALRLASQSFPKCDHHESENWNAGPPGAALMKLLGAPFPAEAVHWKPQKVSFQANRALAVAYLDAREVAGRLDEVVGPLGWQVVHQVLGDQLVTGIGIRDPATGGWVWKWDSGFVGKAQYEDEKESGGSDPIGRRDDEGKARKGTLSDGLKRAAVLWGIGRYLYRLPKVWVAYDPKRKSLADTPRLPPWALPAAPRELHTRSPEEEVIPPPGEISGPGGATRSPGAGRPAPNQGQCLPAGAQGPAKAAFTEAKPAGLAGDALMSASGDQAGGDGREQKGGDARSPQASGPARPISPQPPSGGPSRMGEPVPL